MPRRPAPAVPRLSLAISLLALVVALGGTAVAAGLAANSVGTKQLKKAAVTTKKIKKKAVRTATIKDGAVTGAKVADGSLGKADLADGVLPAAPVTIIHTVPAGTALPAQTVGGLRFRPSCTMNGGETRAAVAIDPASSAPDALQLSGVQVTNVGPDRFPTALLSVGLSGLEPAALAIPGEGTATTAYEGTVRSGPQGAWVDVSLGVRAFLAGNCELVIVLRVLG